MSNKSILILIANELTKRRESKKHGGYNIYEDDKIYISYDTYFPNVRVSVIADGEEHTVFSSSGHNITSVYHSGEWENYVSKELLPKAKAAKEGRLIKQEEREAKAHQEKFGAASKSLHAVFSS